MRKRLVPFLVLAVALAGCIEFDRQTVTYEHDAKADTLLIHQIYHGLHGSDDVTQLSEKEREQLGSVMKGQRTFFFANWIFELNVESFKEALASSATPETNSLKEAQRRAMTNLLALAVANVRVENGKFFLNDKGQPCGTQRVTIRNVSQLLAAGNAAIRKAWEVELKDKTAVEERELINASLARPEPFVTLAGQRLQVRFPLFKAAYDKSVTEDDYVKRLIAEFVRQGGVLSHEKGEVNLRFGRPDATRESVTLPMAASKGFQSNALAHLRDTYGLAKDFDAKKDTEAFLRAKTPPAKQ